MPTKQYYFIQVPFDFFSSSSQGSIWINHGRREESQGAEQDFNGKTRTRQSKIVINANACKHYKEAAGKKSIPQRTETKDATSKKTHHPIGNHEFLGTGARGPQCLLSG